jgi:hypothetical protein
MLLINKSQTKQKKAHISNNTFNNIISLVTMKKLEQVIKELPNHKTIGLFGFTYEYWKHTNIPVHEALLEVFNRVIDHKTISNT